MHLVAMAIGVKKKGVLMMINLIINLLYLIRPWNEYEVNFLMKIRMK